MSREETDGPARIPICLVTGFLGTGKTTFLKHVIEKNKERRLIYLVNEFSPKDIDGAILSRTTPDVVTIPGGSIFCKCLVTEFIGQLSSIVVKHPDTEGVVIEASGMANPKVIDRMLQETGLDAEYALAHIVTIIDPGSFVKLRKTLPNIVAQVEMADTVLINKADLFTEAELADTETAVLSINPNTRILPSVRARAELDLFTPEERSRAQSGEYAKCKDPNYRSFTVRPHEGVSVDKLQELLDSPGDDIYRIKGDILSDLGPLHLEYTSSGLTLDPIEEAENLLVVITSGSPSPATEELCNWLRAEG